VITTLRHRARLAAASAVAGLALAGCAGEPGPSTAPEEPMPVAPAAPTAETVEWTDSVCSALIPVAEGLANPPAFDISAPDATRDAYLAYLAQAQSAADGALENVAAAGAPPVEGGEEVVAEVKEDITELRDDLVDARTQLEQAAGNDPAAIGRSVVVAGNVIGALGNNAQALSAIDGEPRLDAAYSQAPACERLRGIGMFGDDAQQ
jgi:hypothetical protein